MLECDVIVLAVSDHAIAEVAQTLVQTGLVTRRHCMLHCSGAVSSAEVLGAVRDKIGKEVMSPEELGLPQPAEFDSWWPPKGYTPRMT